VRRRCRENLLKVRTEYFRTFQGLKTFPVSIIHHHTSSYIRLRLRDSACDPGFVVFDRGLSFPPVSTRHRKHRNHMDQRRGSAGPSSSLTAPLLARQASREPTPAPAPTNASTNLLRRTEAKAFFANERTFLHWMNMAVTTGSISAALLGVSGHAHKHWGSEYVKRAVSVRVLALLMMGISIGMACYAAYNFKKRGDMLVNKLDGPYDSRVLPVVLTVVMMLFLVVVWVGALVSYHHR
jgi:uncharacterized membrane protein YidH (DUF202 family)